MSIETIVRTILFVAVIAGLLLIADWLREVVEAGMDRYGPY